MPGKTACKRARKDLHIPMVNPKLKGNSLGKLYLNHGNYRQMAGLHTLFYRRENPAEGSFSHGKVCYR